MRLDRRTLLGSSAAVTAALGANFITQAQAQTSAAAPVTALAAPPPATAILARYLVGARFEDLPANVRKQGVRTFLNWMGCSVGGSRHETVDHAIAALAPFSGKPEAMVMGRSDKLDILNATLVTGIASHIF